MLIKPRLDSGFVSSCLVSETRLGGGRQVHQQEESGQVSNSAGKRDQNPEGERASADVCLLAWTPADGCLFPAGAETRQHCCFTGFSGRSSSGGALNQLPVPLLTRIIMSRL